MADCVAIERIKTDGGVGAAGVTVQECIVTEGSVVKR